MAGEVFTIRPLQLYAVTQQLRQGKPTCANGDAKTDLGHILDFTCRLKYLKVNYSVLSLKHYPHQNKLTVLKCCYDI